MDELLLTCARWSTTHHRFHPGMGLWLLARHRGVRSRTGPQANPAEDWARNGDGITAAGRQVVHGSKKSTSNQAGEVSAIPRVGSSASFADNRHRYHSFCALQGILNTQLVISRQCLGGRVTRCPTGAGQPRTPEVRENDARPPAQPAVGHGSPRADAGRRPFHSTLLTGRSTHQCRHRVAVAWCAAQRCGAMTRGVWTSSFTSTRKGNLAVAGIHCASAATPEDAPIWLMAAIRCKNELWRHDRSSC